MATFARAHKNYKNYTKAMLREAYVDVNQNNVPIRKAAKRHGMPESTLRFRLKHQDGTAVESGGPTLFTRTQEEALAEHCISLCHIGYGFSRWQIIEMASNMCEVVGLNNRTPSKQWFYGFLKRFPELKMVKPKKRERARDVAVTTEMLQKYFESLKSAMEKYSILNQPERIWNVDESGISLDHNPPKVLTKTGENPYVVTHGKSATTTLIAAASALGHTIPPYIIFKAQRLSKEMKTSGIAGTEYRTSETGWSNSVLFLDFFENHFLRHVKTRPCMLLYDGHSTHINVGIIEKARENDVHLFVLPPHSSHCLQPLDVSVFGPFKCSLNSQIHKFMHNNPSSVITYTDLPGFIGTAYNSALTVSTIMSGFRKSGIFPFDPNAPETTPPTINKSTERKTISRTERKDNRNIKILFQEKVSNFNSAVEEQKNTTKGTKRKTFVPPYGCLITENEKYLEKKETELQKEQKNPKEPVRKNGKRKSSFKVPLRNADEVVEEAECRDQDQSGKKRKENGESKGKGPRKNSKKGKGPCRKTTPKKSKADIDSDEEDTEVCVMCSKWQPDALNLQTSIKFVEWGQCTNCLKWVHLKFCTNVERLSENDDFLCPLCTNEQ